MSQEFTFKNLGCFWSDATAFWEDTPPKIHIQDRRRGSRNQFCLHMTEQLEDVNLQILTVGKTLVLYTGELYSEEVSW